MSSSFVYSRNPNCLVHVISLFIRSQGQLRTLQQQRYLNVWIQANLHRQGIIQIRYRLDQTEEEYVEQHLEIFSIQRRLLNVTLRITLCEFQCRLSLRSPYNYNVITLDRVNKTLRVSTYIQSMQVKSTYAAESGPTTCLLTWLNLVWRQSRHTCKYTCILLYTAQHLLAYVILQTITYCAFFHTSYCHNRRKRM